MWLKINKGIFNLIFLFFSQQKSFILAMTWHWIQLCEIWIRQNLARKLELGYFIQGQGAGWTGAGEQRGLKGKDWPTRTQEAAAPGLRGTDLGACGQQEPDIEGTTPLSLLPIL